MPTCLKCGNIFPNRIIFNGKKVNVSSRNFCINCSPYMKHNTRDLRIEKIVNDKEKQCTVCGKIKELKYFYFKNTENRYHSSCKECLKKDVIGYQIRNKIKAIQYLGGKCLNCGIDDVRVLVFHHKNGLENKEALWNDLRCCGWEKIKKEIDKCKVLCSNCHLIHHTKYNYKTPV